MTPALFNTPQKVSTTVRLDLGLKRQAEEYARAHHMDFTTFLSFSLQSTMRFGGRTESYYKISAEYAQEIDDLVHRIDT